MKIGLFPYEIGGKKHEEQTIQIRRGILHSVNHHNREYGGETFLCRFPPLQFHPIIFRLDEVAIS